ncbi:hypothetical protein ACF07T_07565 [Streptomyces sp. NPDC015184]|uniref:hypothetical protein n=1 Tax=Streptomyces sp. NPDC015184 TaxID=3364946 RepID=UPI0036F5B4C6
MTARTQIGGVPVSGDGPAAPPGADGSVELFHRAAAKAALTTVRTGRTAAGVGLGGPAPGRRPAGPRRVRCGGRGPYAARPPVLLGRTEKGLIRLRTPDGTLVRRQGPPASDGPALHVGRDGRPVVVALGPDALPWVWRP